MNTEFIANVKENFNVPTMARTEKVGKKVSDVYEIFKTGKDKDGKDITTTIQIRDKATVALLSDIDVLAYMAKGSIKGFVCAMGKISREVAKKAGFKSVVDMVYENHKDYSRTTLNLYRRIGILFTDKENSGYEWIDWIPSSVSVNNLSVVLALACNGVKDLEECTQDEINELLENFYCEYIATGLINLTTTQSELKKAVKSIATGIIDGTVKETDNSNNSDENSENSENSASDLVADAKIDILVKYHDTISEMSDYFKDNETIVNAIATIMKELSLIAEKSENSEN